MSATRYDFVVIGAGSAGCVLAYRLSADPDTSVLLIEAGPSDWSPRVQMPSAFAYAISHANYDWNFEAEPEPGLADRVLHHPGGKVLGGSSSINAMGFTRGHPLDFERWAANELPSWSYAHCLPYFKRMERFSGGASEFRGGEGPLAVTAPAITHPLNEAFLEACEQAGYPRSNDSNANETDGFSVMDQTIHSGRRMSTAVAYLRPAAERPNLTVLTRAFVTRILFEGKRAVGIKYVAAGKVQHAFAERETILSAGAVNSPRLLMLSGVGSAKTLRELDIALIADSPGVGTNLQDHIDVSVKMTCSKPVSDTHYLKLHRKALIGLRWLLFKTGPGATNHFEVGGTLRSRSQLAHPDLAVWFIPMLVRSDGSSLAHEHGFQATSVCLRPRSRGRITLRSNDPAQPPLLLCNYLDDPQDLESLREGIARVRGIFGQKAFDSYREKEVEPGETHCGTGQLDDFIRTTAKSTHHLSCTCPMGSGPLAVVDESARVYGVDALRVVDASIMPTIVSAALNATTIMIAEKLADDIAGAQPLPPLHDNARRVG